MSRDKKDCGRAGEDSGSLRKKEIPCLSPANNVFKPSKKYLEVAWWEEVLRQSKYFSLSQISSLYLANTFTEC